MSLEKIETEWFERLFTVIRNRLYIITYSHWHLHDLTSFKMTSMNDAFRVAGPSISEPNESHIDFKVHNLNLRNVWSSLLAMKRSQRLMPSKMRGC